MAFIGRPDRPRAVSAANPPMSATLPVAVGTPTSPPALLHAWPWTGLLALVSAHVLLRLLLSPALELDEAEQIMWSQALALGYGVQPPLYTWLQWSFNAVFGPSILALALLKHLLLAGTYALLWHAARRQGLGQRTAWWASASVLLFPVIGWMAVRDLTHTVLLLFFSALLYDVLVHQVQRPRPLGFVWLGVALAGGLMAKYSFALVAAALLGAAALEPGARRALTSRGWWLAALVALALCLPHGLWAWEHGDLIAARMVRKLEPGAGGAPVFGRGLLALAGALASSVALWLLAALAAFRGGWWSPGVRARVDVRLRLVANYLGLVLLALLAMALFAGVTRFKARWIEPLLILLPTAAFLWRPQLEHDRRGRAFTAAIVGCALLGLAMNAARPYYNMWRERPDDVNLPVLALTQAALETGYDGRAPIWVTSNVLGGALRTQFPHVPVRRCAPPLCATMLQAHGGLLVLDVRHADAARAGLDIPNLRTLRLPYLHATAGSPALSARFALAWRAPTRDHGPRPPVAPWQS